LDNEIKKIQKELKRDGETYFVDSLKDYSPKMASMLRRLNDSTGLSMIYTQYRMLEGIWAVSQVLSFNGWAELNVKKIKRTFTIQIGGEDVDDITELSVFKKPRYIVFTDDAKMNELLLDIFRGNTTNMGNKIVSQIRKITGYSESDIIHNRNGEIAKTLMITKSGAEGISLKNVRQVHILEPYWNMNRIDQVSGRAIRMGSHSDLPVDERHVDVFVYISKLTKSQLSSNLTLKGNDKSMTTDQMIWKRANDKLKLISPFLESLKKASIDCNFHGFDGIRCFKSKSKTGDLDILGDIDIDNKKLHGNKVTIQGVDYIWVISSKKLYDLNFYMRTRKLKHVGFLEKKSDDIFFIEIF